MNARSKLSIGKLLLFWFGLTFTVSAPLYAELVLRQTTAAWIAVLSGIFLTLMAKYDELIEFSFGPVKARMRETIREANATIEQLQKVAIQQSKAMLLEMMAGSFMGGTRFQNKLDLHDNLIENLKEIGLSQTDLRDVDEYWKRGMGIIYHRMIRHSLGHGPYPDNPNATTGTEVNETIKQIEQMMDFANWLAPSPDEMEYLIKRKNLMTLEVKEWIADYRHYLKTGQILRRDLFDEK